MRAINDWGGEFTGVLQLKRSYRFFSRRTSVWGASLALRGRKILANKYLLPSTARGQRITNSPSDNCPDLISKGRNDNYCFAVSLASDFLSQHRRIELDAALFDLQPSDVVLAAVGFELFAVQWQHVANLKTIKDRVIYVLVAR